MKITIKVNASEMQEGKQYDSIINSFEVAVDGDSQQFLDLVSQIIKLVPVKVKVVEG